MHFLINKTRRIDWGLHRKNIRTLEPKDSKCSDLLQLTDILLGACVQQPGSPAKATIKNIVNDLEKGSEKLSEIPFEPIRSSRRT